MSLKHNILTHSQLDEASLGMPSRDYYLNTEHEVDAQAYLRYMGQVAEYMGADPGTVQAEMKKVLSLETAIANVGQIYS